MYGRFEGTSSWVPLSSRDACSSDPIKELDYDPTLSEDKTSTELSTGRASFREQKSDPAVLPNSAPRRKSILKQPNQQSVATSQSQPSSGTPPSKISEKTQQNSNQSLRSVGSKDDQVEESSRNLGKAKSVAFSDDGHDDDGTFSKQNSMIKFRSEDSQYDVSQDTAYLDSSQSLIPHSPSGTTSVASAWSRRTTRREGVFGTLDIKPSEFGFKKSQSNLSQHQDQRRSQGSMKSRRSQFSDEDEDLNEDEIGEERDAPEEPKGICLRIVQTKSFQWITALAVLLNCIMLGLEVVLVDWKAEQCSVDELRSVTERCKVESSFYFMDYIFLVVFSFELGMRIQAFGFRQVASSSTGLLDVVIVFTGWLSEVIIPLLLLGAMGPDLKAMQVLKMLRVLRAVRILRMLTMFEDLWFIVQSFLWCLEPLSWIMLFMGTVLFLFAILAINFIGGNKEFADFPWLGDRFGSTFRAMITLFRIMVLDEWYEIVSPLFERAWWTYLFFVLYIAISALALMNLVTAVVVDTSVRRSKDESKNLEENNMFEQFVGRYVKDFEALFEMFDVDRSGSLQVDEFSIHAPDAPLIGNLGKFLEFESREDWDEFFFLMSCGSRSLGLDDFIESIAKLTQATSDRTSVALIKTSKTREERFKQIRKIVEREPELAKQVNNMQDVFDKAGIRIARIHTRLDTFQQEVAEQVKELKSEMQRLSALALSGEPIVPLEVPDSKTPSAAPRFKPLKPRTSLFKHAADFQDEGKPGEAGAGVGLFPSSSDEKNKRGSRSSVSSISSISSIRSISSIFKGKNKAKS